MKILAVGDVVGSAGVAYLKANLRRFAEFCGAGLVIVNGENAADIHGISSADAAAIFAAGADVITTGNHAFGRRDIYELLDSEPRLLRPDNFPGGAPGHGTVTVNAGDKRVLIINLQGSVAMREAVSPPFAAVDAILRREAGGYDVAVLDFHAEATSEKVAMGYYLDGRVSVVFGTHTHVATSDARVLPRGSGYITDIGMTGPADGVLGAAAEPVIRQFLTSMPQRYSVAAGNVSASGALFTLDGSGACTAVRSVTF